MNSTVGESHFLGAENTILVVSVFTSALIASYMIRQSKFASYYVPESIAAMVIGVIAGGFARLAYDGSKEKMGAIKFKPEVFFFILLPGATRARALCCHAVAPRARGDAARGWAG